VPLCAARLLFWASSGHRSTPRGHKLLESDPAGVRSNLATSATGRRPADAPHRGQTVPIAIGMFDAIARGRRVVGLALHASAGERPSAQFQSRVQEGVSPHPAVMPTPVHPTEFQSRVREGVSPTKRLRRRRNYTSVCFSPAYGKALVPKGFTPIAPTFTPFQSRVREASVPRCQWKYLVSANVYKFQSRVREGVSLTTALLPQIEAAFPVSVPRTGRR
jgi:hypothetical protein